MHCGVMVTGDNQGDWDRLMQGDYARPPTVSDAENMDDPLSMGELVEPHGFDSIWATEHYGSAYSMQPNPLPYLGFTMPRSAIWWMARHKRRPLPEPPAAELPTARRWARERQP